MKLFSRFLPGFCIALYFVMFNTPIVSQANDDEVTIELEIDAAQDIAGTWNVVETYTCCGDYPSKWVITKKSETSKAIKYTVKATRTSTGNVVNGKAKLRKSNNKSIVKHPCYGEGCGSCAYKFKGTATATSITGSADYCNGGATGTFVATRVSSNSDEGFVTEGSGNGPDPM